jgi:hypothetical protein
MAGLFLISEKIRAAVKENNDRASNIEKFNTENIARRRNLAERKNLATNFYFTWLRNAAGGGARTWNTAYTVPQDMILKRVLFTSVYANIHNFWIAKVEPGVSISSSYAGMMTQGRNRIFAAGVICGYTTPTIINLGDAGIVVRRGEAIQHCVDIASGGTYLVGGRLEFVSTTPGNFYRYY